MKNQERGKMSNNYEQDQEKIINAVGQTVQTAVVTGANWWLSHPKSVKVEVSTPKMPTVSKDMEIACEAISEGASIEEVVQIINQGEMARTIKNNHGNSQSYSHLIAKGATISEAVKQKQQGQSPHLQKNIKRNKGMTL